MRFLANENFPLPSIRLLRDNGHFVKSISSDAPGIRDTEVIEIALNEKLIILTFNKDYGEIIFRYGASLPPSVIFFRFRGSGPSSEGATVLALLREEVEFSDLFTVVDENNIRQRKYQP